jgi:hypothetical protein
MKKWSEFLEGRCWPGYKPKPGKKAFSPGSCMKESAAAAVAAAIAISKKKSGNYDKEGFRKTTYKNPDHPNRKSNTERESELKEDLRKWFSKTDPKGGWKRINSKGEAIGPCAREPGEAKPKCMSNEKRASLSKKERASAVSAKRRHDPNPERKGQPINVSNFGKGKISENMENLDEKNVPTSPEKWAQAKSQAKAKFDVYPSAYANGWAAKKYKAMGGGWKSVSEAKDEQEYGYEGDMALNQLATLTRCADMIKELLKPDTDMPEWVQSKITLATDYIQTAADYMYSEMKEEVDLDEADTLLARTGMNSAHKFPRSGQTNLGNIPAMNTPGNSKETDAYAEKRRGDRAKQLKPAIKAALGTHGPKGKLPEEVEPIEELSKDTLKSYIPAAARDLSKKGVNAGIEAKSGKPGVTKEYGDHFEKRYKGIIKATRKLAKEQAEPIEELSRETLHQYWIKAVPWSVTHKMIASAARKDAAAITDPNDHYGAHDLRMKARGHSMIGKKRDAGIEKATARLKKDSEKNYYKDHWKANRGYYGPEQPLQKEEVSKTSDATTSAEIGTPAQLSLKVTPKKLETPVYESRQLQIVREAMADAKKKDAAKKKEQKVNPGGDDKFQSEPELTSSITKNAQ